MFAPSDFRSPRSPRPPMRKNRAIGMGVLIIFAFLCLIMAVGMDSTVFIPYNATHAVTQTWEANHPPTPARTPPAPAPRRRLPSNDQQVRDPDHLRFVLT
jgi:hypothetical protein